MSTRPGSTLAAIAVAFPLLADEPPDAGVVPEPSPKGNVDDGF
jgi:hypothetical protein